MGRLVQRAEGHIALAVFRRLDVPERRAEVAGSVPDVTGVPPESSLVAADEPAAARGC